MKKMLALSFLLMIFIFMSSIAAQNDPTGAPKNPAKKLEKQLNILKEKLELTEDQITKVKDLLSKNMEEMTEIREKMSGEDSSAMRDAMKKSREELDKKIVALLDAKQKEEYVKYQKEQAEQKANKQKG
jgi:Skp family chaperone for outer membrane proteins